MKTKHIIFSLLAVFAFASALFFNACKKDVVSEAISQSESEFQNSEFTEGVLTFIDRCKNLTENPGLKDEDEIDVDVAVTNLEAAMNLMYTYYVKTSELYTATSEIVITVDQKNEMTESNIAQALEDLEDAVADDYGNAPYTNKKLIAVMLDYEVENDVHSIIVTSYTGNTLIAPLITDRNWKYGMTKGTCEYELPEITGTDAAKQIQISVQATLYESPPSGTTYYWPNPQPPAEYYVEPEEGYDINPYKNSNDPDGIENNHLDYTIFLNHSQVLVSPYFYDDERCLYKNDEIPFYKTSYISFGNLTIANTSYKIKLCDFNGLKRYQSVTNDEYIRHELTYIYGIRHECATVSYPTNID